VELSLRFDKTTSLWVEVKVKMAQDTERSRSCSKLC